MKTKSITLLGSTGSIGRNSLNVLGQFPDKYQVYALTAHKNTGLLLEQVQKFKPHFVVLTDEAAYQDFKQKAPPQVEVLYGNSGLEQVATAPEVDFVIAAIVGAAGLRPFIKALEAGKRVGLANKEVLVIAGEYLHQTYGAPFLDQILPIDSEHSAIFQCMLAGRKEEVESIVLTASGGPFRNRASLEGLTIAEALNHPNWDMGPKITIDSATLMNKGLELMEAYWLFPIDLDRIQVVIHPQSLIHSMVTYRDGSVLAHLGVADMRIPIQYALSYPERWENNLERLDFASLRSLTFEEPDLVRFPCLSLAREALQKGNVFPAVLNAANEISVKSFLEGKISFQQMAVCNQHVLRSHKPANDLDLQSLLNADTLARKEASEWISSQFSAK